MGKFHVLTNFLVFDMKFPHTCLVILLPNRETMSGNSSDALANNWGNFMSDTSYYIVIWYLTLNLPKTRRALT